MKDSAYLIFDKHGIRKMTKTKPVLGQGEFATKLLLQCDDGFFDQIIPVTSIQIEDDFLITPKVTVTPLKEATNAKPR